MYIYIYIFTYRRLGLVQPGNSFVSFVRARAAVCKVRMDLKNDPDPFSLFPFGPDMDSFPFPL